MGVETVSHIVPTLPPKVNAVKVKTFFSTWLSRQHVCSDWILVQIAQASLSMGSSLSFNGLCTFLVNMVGTSNLLPYWVLVWCTSRLCDISVTAASWWLCAFEIAKLDELGWAKCLGQSRGLNNWRNEWRKEWFDGAQVRGTENYQPVARKERQGYDFYRRSCLYPAQEKGQWKSPDSEIVLGSNPSSATC